MSLDGTIGASAVWEVDGAGRTGLVGSMTWQLVRLPDGLAMTTATTAGVQTAGAADKYSGTFTRPSTAGTYALRIVVPGVGTFDESFTASAATGGTTGGVLVGGSVGGSQADPSVFLIKRGDTEPDFSVQLRAPDPANPTQLIPWPVPSGATVKFTMRDTTDFNTETRTGFPVGAPKVHANATPDSSDRSIVSYAWVAGDTDTNGTYRGEIEVTNGSDVRTFPVGRTMDTNFITISIVDDADPGINP